MTPLLALLLGLSIPATAKPVSVSGQLSNADWADNHDLVAVVWEVDLVRQSELPIVLDVPVSAEGKFTFELPTPPPDHYYAPDPEVPRFRIATYLVAVLADDLLIGVMTTPIVRTRGPLPQAWLDVGAKPGWSVLDVDNDGDPAHPLMAVPIDDGGLDIWLPGRGHMKADIHASI
jgi:hypothetical protein